MAATLRRLAFDLKGEGKRGRSKALERGRHDRAEEGRRSGPSASMESASHVGGDSARLPDTGGG